MEDPKQFYMKGLSHLSTGDLDDALSCFQKSVEIKPDFLEGHLGIVQTYERKQMLDQAISAARKAIEVDPNEPLAHTSLSRLFQQKGMVPEAEEEMAISLRLQSDL